MTTQTGTSRSDSLYGGTAQDVLRGLGGDDYLSGSGGDDRLSGHEGDDWLDGGAGRDTLSGDGGGDTLDGGAGDDTVSGGDGDDYLRSAYGGDDRLHGGGGADMLSGHSAGADTLIGGAGNDRLDGQGGADQLLGEAGDDILHLRAGGKLLDGGTGRDTISFLNLAAGMTYTIGDGTFRTTGGPVTLRGFENATGSYYADKLTGDGRGNVIDGGYGADTLRGGSGDDTILGGSGSDVMWGAGGFDFVSYAYLAASSGSTGVSISLGITGPQRISAGEVDTLTSFEGVIGGDLDDTLRGGDANEIFRGGLGDDQITGGGGSDTADYSDARGHVRIDLRRSGAQATGMGSDRLLRIENLLGGAGDDRLVGSDGNNRLAGGAGDDTLVGAAGDDRLSGGTGFDIADYSIHDGPTRLSLADARSAGGTGGKDAYSSIEGLVGGRGADHLTGDGRGNLLAGAAGDDTILGAGGDDTLRGGAGANDLSGGAGSDWADYADMSTRLRIDLSAERQSNAGAGVDRLISIENATGGSGSDRLVGSRGGNVLSGGGGDDTLIGGAGNDRLIGGAGDDVLDAGSGKNQRLVGGTGNDTYILGNGAGGGVIEDMGGGADKLDASGANAAARIDLGIGMASSSGDTMHRIAGTGTSSLPLDLVLAQDLSGSFDSDLVNMRAHVPDIARISRRIDPDSAFGAVGFIDKPLSPFGSSSDYVYDVYQKVTTSSSALASAYATMTVGSGGDAFEGQIEALLQIARHAGDEVGFRADTLRLVVLFTDADYHQAGDAGNLRANDGDGHLEGRKPGTGEDYPSVGQLRSALASAGILPVFAVTEHVTDSYSDLVRKLGFGGVVSIDDDSTDVVRAVRDAVTLATSTTIEDAEGTRFNDVIRGNAANNQLIGGQGDDKIHGLSGADRLLGGVGDDILSGGVGDDRLTGGSGADRLTGGQGADMFIFEKASDSRPRVRDVITDFQHGGDKIDLRAIDAKSDVPGDQSLKFIGAAHSGHRGELFYLRDGDIAILRADLGGHAGYEIEIAVHASGLTGSDFLL